MGQQDDKYIVKWWGYTDTTTEPSENVPLNMRTLYHQGNISELWTRWQKGILETLVQNGHFQQAVTTQRIQRTVIKDHPKNKEMKIVDRIETKEVVHVLVLVLVQVEVLLEVTV